MHLFSTLCVSDYNGNTVHYKIKWSYTTTAAASTIMHAVVKYINRLQYISVVLRATVLRAAQCCSGEY